MRDKSPKTPLAYGIGNKSETIMYNAPCQDTLHGHSDRAWERQADWLTAWVTGRDANEMGNGIGINMSEVLMERVDCDKRRSLLYEVLLVRNINRYLLLDDLRISLVTDTPGKGVGLIDASNKLDSTHTMADALGFVEEMAPDLDMFAMHGTWHGRAEVFIVHVMGRGALTIIVPQGTSDVTRKTIVGKVRKGIRLAHI